MELPFQSAYGYGLVGIGVPPGGGYPAGVFVRAGATVLVGGWGVKVRVGGTEINVLVGGIEIDVLVELGKGVKLGPTPGVNVAGLVNVRVDVAPVRLGFSVAELMGVGVCVGVAA